MVLTPDLLTKLTEIFVEKGATEREAPTLAIRYFNQTKEFATGPNDMIAKLKAAEVTKKK